MAISGLAQQRSNQLYNNSAITKNTFGSSGKSKKSASSMKSLGASSGGVRKNTRLENLMKQKEQLMKRKQSIIERGLQEGEDPSSIQKKLKEVDKQIEEIDKQINKLQTEDQRKAMGTDGKNKRTKKTDQVNQTKETRQGIKDDASTENINRIMAASKSLSKVKELSKVKQAELGEKRVQEIEINTDIGRGLNPVRKENRVAEIDDNIDNINEKIADSYKEIHKKTAENTKEYDSIGKASKSSHDKDTENYSVSQQQIEEDIKSYTGNMKDNEKKENGAQVDAKA